MTTTRRTFGLAVLAGFLAVTLACGLAQAEQGDGDKAVTSEGEYWPWAMDLPDDLQKAYDAGRKRKSEQKRILAWAPKGVKRIRAMLLIVANSDSKHFGEHDETRKVAAKHEMGIVYLRYALQSKLDRVDDIFAKVEKDTGVKGFRHAPWITFGKSSMGKFPYYMAWKYPERTIATISYHAETPTWPMAKWSKLKDHSILHVSVNGEIEWGGTFAKHVRPSLLNYRANSGLLPHQVVVHGVGHGDYVDAHGSKGWGRKFPDKFTVQEVWDYLAKYVDKALELRLPEKGYPVDGPLELRQVDASKGVLLERFAVEDIFRKPRMELVEENGAYVVAPPEESKVNGYAEIPPAKDYKPADGVPVVDLSPGKSPTDWLVTKGLQFAMKADPMTELPDAIAQLRPEPNDVIEIDGRKATFTPIADSEIGRRGGIARGIAMKGGLSPRNKQVTVIGYTVLKVDKPTALKVTGYHSLAVRLQIVLNGRPVDHKQVVKLDKGLYPMLFVVRMKSVTWGHVEPSLDPVSDELVAEAKAMQESKAAKERAFRERFADGPRKPESFVHDFDDVPQGRRDDMFWLPDRDLAGAWLKLHDVSKKQKK